ncbi:type II toxin-antitoxin system PemK/MazF family toxin [Arthrobacter oryzae]|uniref:type II toxin-antitoxin system PemK/MazF family toxin n=1 Tax=Arthrobacter oryzae TaxID=409290 RepID=UPI0027897FA2|nr:type II toxin-antitoxin system PemK/MazF family toxin [Arthrobacter oryzae]MDQ0075947.1 hypothetical protein [Arthrobacter oryzae]
MALNLRSLGKAVRAALRFLEGRPAKDHPGNQSRARGTQGGSTPLRPTPGSAPQPHGAAGGAAVGISGKYPGDFKGVTCVKYAPSPNGKPEPGEVVWTWVPYEEDHSQGKDRPVLLIGSRGRYLLGLMLTSKDHDQDRRKDESYVDIGTGSWDRQRRPSEAKLDRILQIRPGDIRREGAVLDRKRFDSVSSALRELHGWS